MDPLFRRQSAITETVKALIAFTPQRKTWGTQDSDPDDSNMIEFEVQFKP